MPLAVKALQTRPTIESDASSDTDQEVFYPYHSTMERVYTSADIGLAPEDRYKRLMGCCTNAGNVCGFTILLQIGCHKISIGDESWDFAEILK